MLRSSRPTRPRAAVATLLLAGLALVAAPPPAPGGPGPVGHRPPVEAPVTDPFRPPEMPFGPGNRGIEYRTAPGTPVMASAAGEVVFAGQVGGALHVTVRHPGGVRTSYSFLAAVDVVVGQRVHRGEPLGRSGHRLHFGARRGDGYFDPASLFGTGAVRVELVPFEVPPGSAPDTERAGLRMLIAGDGGGGLVPGVDLGAAVGWLRDRAGTLADQVSAADPSRWALRTAWRVARHAVSRRPCSGEGEVADRGVASPSPGRADDRLALTVGGLGSTSRRSTVDRLDLRGLGYGPGDVVRFSYGGGHTPAGAGAGLDGAALTAYSSEDTQGDLRRSGERLADLVEAAARARPGAEVDIYGHSMGGVVARLALLELERRGFPLDRLGLVTTLGTPHGGADLATLVRTARSSMLGGPGLDVLEAVLDTGLDPDAAAVTQLAEGSPVVEALADRGLPGDVALLSVGARGDPVVPLPRSRVPGARNVTVPGRGWQAHRDVVTSDVTHREIRLALANLPSRCVGAWDVLLDETVARGVVLVEDSLDRAALTVP